MGPSWRVVNVIVQSVSQRSLAETLLIPCVNLNDNRRIYKASHGSSITVLGISRMLC